MVGSKLAGCVWEGVPVSTTVQSPNLFLLVFTCNNELQLFFDRTIDRFKKLKANILK